MAAKLGTILVLAIPVAIAAVVAASTAKAAPKPGAPLPPSKPPPGAAPPPPPPPPGGTDPVGGNGFIASLPEHHSGMLDDPREVMLIAGVNAGLYDPINWQAVISDGEPGTEMEGYSLIIPVMGDALMFEGVRVIGNYQTGQYIADALSAREGFTHPITMMTPYAAGLVSEQADAKLSPTTSGQLSNKGVTALKSQFVEASAAVDRKLARALAELAATGPVLVSNPGKDWVVTRRFLEPGRHPKSNVLYAEAAANHGLYTAPWQPIQNVGLAHNRGHLDYSQALRYLGGDSILVTPDAQHVQIATADAITDSKLGPLINGPRGKLRGKQVGEGSLPYWRHPKVPAREVIV